MKAAFVAQVFGAGVLLALGVMLAAANVLAAGIVLAAVAIAWLVWCLRRI